MRGEIYHFCEVKYIIFVQQFVDTRHTGVETCTCKMLVPHGISAEKGTNTVLVVVPVWS